MPHSVKDLSDYRLERAKEDIQTAKINICLLYTSIQGRLKEVVSNGKIYITA